ncbi:MAG: BufA1 family periplasmic bufferin-type metallophore [Alphaproteobacteria bacterium]
MTSKKTLHTLLAGAVAVGALGAGATAAHAMKKDQEKCYGVVKAGKNGCGSADKAHGCAGLAKEDASGVEWVSLPKGTCEKLAGGSLEPVFDDAEDKKH